MYDLIGDIHGHADELVSLLGALGYERTGGVYGHPERQVIFVGDFIDRGPQIRQVLEIVRPMVEEGTALAVMGNHELNALAYHTTAPGGYLRPHIDKNVDQHRQTVEQLTPDELAASLEWFRTLPLWLELDGLRVVHACWDERAVEAVASGLRHHEGVTPAFLRAACLKGQALFAPVEVLLKGKEAALPEGLSFLDKDGHRRTAIRTQWYLPAEGRTYGNYALQADEVPCDLVLEGSVLREAAAYPATAKPVFFGHYWLAADRPPSVLAANVACLDYSVAKGGFLCAYRWQGEQQLRDDHFLTVPAQP
jgi:hypothetical protein